MRAVFYTFTKRINSTAQPSGGTEYNISLKGDTGILSPEVSLQWTGSGNPCAYNYAWLPDFSRYYWVKNWTYSERQWIASLAVDVLASWKTAIGSTSKYILRSASDYDPEVLDTVYPATGEIKDYYSVSLLTWPTNPLTGGSYILNVSGGDQTTTNIGGCAYYVCTAAEIQRITLQAFSQVDAMASDYPSFVNVQDWNIISKALLWVGETVIRCTTDIGQFINSIMWIPVDPAEISDQNVKTPVFCGVIQVGTASALDDPTWLGSMSFDLSSATGASGILTDAAWEWVSPYAEYYFKLLPFGVIPLDSLSTRFYCQNIQATVKIDMISGLAVLQIVGNKTVGGILQQSVLAVRSAQLGIPIGHGGAHINYVEALSDLVGGISGGAALAASGGTAIAALGPTVSGIGNAAMSLIPSSMASGRSGGTAAIETIGTLRCKQLQHVPQDITENGRPLCQIRTINTLSGYIQTRDGDITAPATDGELDQISNYLTGGFFYE